MGYRIKKAVIPAAGLGTRFLPATKSVPKEMLPIVDRPSLLFIVEEALQAGLDEVIFVAGRNKSAIEDFFDRSYELEDTLEKTGKTELLNRVREIQTMVRVISVRQKKALGLGHAVGTAAPIVGQEAFAVLLGDEIMMTENNEPNVTAQLVNMYKEKNLSTVAVMPVEKDQVSKYGIIEKEDLGDERFQVRSVVEKPEPETAPSQWALPGRYVFTPKVFEFIASAKPGKNGEIQLTDAMTSLAQTEGLLATSFKAKRYDAGDKLGYLKANVEWALQHPEVGESFRKYLKGLSL